MHAIAQTMREFDPLVVYWDRKLGYEHILEQQERDSARGESMHSQQVIVFPRVRKISPVELLPTETSPAHPGIFMGQTFTTTYRIDRELLRAARDQTAVLKMLQDDDLLDSDEELVDWVDV